MDYSLPEIGRHVTMPTALGNVHGAASLDLGDDAFGRSRFCREVSHSQTGEGSSGSDLASIHGSHLLTIIKKVTIRPLQGYNVPLNEA